MLTEANFQLYVGFQEYKSFGPNVLAYLLGYKFKTWVDDIGNMNNDDIIDRLADDNYVSTLSVEINKHCVTCDMTFEAVLEAANYWLRQFPTTDRNIHYANSRIAFNTRRGAGNKILGNTVLYKGNNELDCCLAIVKSSNKYGIVKQPNFDHYGFNLNDGTKV